MYKIYRKVKKWMRLRGYIKFRGKVHTDREVKYHERRGKEAPELGGRGPEAACDPVRPSGKPKTVKNACKKQAFFIFPIDMEAYRRYTKENT